MTCARSRGRVEVTVTLRADAEVLHLEVHDDGRGFDVGRDDDDAFGLTRMNERAQTLGGRFSVQSATGQGTTMRLACPLAARSPASHLSRGRRRSRGERAEGGGVGREVRHHVGEVQHAVDVVTDAIAGELWLNGDPP